MHGLVLCDRAWFQNPAILGEDVLGTLRIRPRWQAAAQATFEHYGLDPGTSVVVHARGRDYRTWPSASSPALVPPAWFAGQVENLRSYSGAKSVLVVGDDYDYAREIQTLIPDSFVHESSGLEAYSHDFALLSLSKFLVISPSTFGFWGAWFARRSCPEGRAIAPRYWIGHRDHVWFPATMHADFLEYSECSSKDYECEVFGFDQP